MSDYREVIKNIEHLESMIPGIFDFDKPDWKTIWNQIRITGKSFKGVKFPSKEEHEKSWSKFQTLVDKVKSKQSENQKDWEKKKRESAQLKEKILAQAKFAIPYDSGLADIILTIVTVGTNLLLESIMGPFDQEKEMLKSCSNQLQKGWSMLRDNKDRMFGKDKRVAFDELNEAKYILDRRWKDYKEQRQRAWTEYQRKKESRRNEWVRKIESNIRSLEERRDRLNGVLVHKENHLDELYDKQSEARSDDFRYVVSDWISEEKSSIADIKKKLIDIEDWIYENKDKLRS